MERKWWTLIAVSVATFMLLLDITVVNTALPSIEEDLGASFTDLQWVIDAYALALAALVLTAGSLADRLGRRRVFAAGLGIFSAASLLCGLASDPTFLNLARGLQGVGGAIMFAVSLALVAQEFPAGRERGTAMGVYGATIGIAVAVGPLVGGALTDSLGWESIFFLNVPIGIVTVAVTYLKLRESRNPNSTRIDWGGLVTFSGALFLLVLALLRGNEEGWGSAFIVSLFAGAALLMAGFIAIERRVKEPMLPLGLFRNRSFTGVQLAAFAVSGSMFALFLYLTLLPPELPRAHAARGRHPLPADHDHELHRGADRRRPALAGPVTLPDERRARTRRDRPLPDVGPRLGLGVDRAARRLPRRRLRHRPAQPGDRRHRGQRRTQGAERYGVGDQRHLPPGRHRGRHRRLGSDVPRAWRRSRSRAEAAPAPGEQPRLLVEAASSGNLDAATANIPPDTQAAVVAAAREGFLAGMNEILVIGALLAAAGAIAALVLVRESEIEREAPAEQAPQEPAAEPVAA